MLVTVLSIPLGMNIHTFRCSDNNVCDYQVLPMTSLGYYVVYGKWTAFPF